MDYAVVPYDITKITIKHPLYYIQLTVGMHKISYLRELSFKTIYLIISKWQCTSKIVSHVLVNVLHLCFIFMQHVNNHQNIFAYNITISIPMQRLFLSSWQMQDIIFALNRSTIAFYDLIFPTIMIMYQFQHVQYSPIYRVQYQDGG